MHLDSAKEARLAGRSFLEVNTVQLRTATSYEKCVRDFVTWLGTNTLPKEMNQATLDQSLVEFLEHLYFDGATSDAGSTLIAALEYHDRRIKKTGALDPKRARDAMKGFRRLSPGFSRSPLPFCALCGLIGAAMIHGRRNLAVAFLVQFCGYLRPNEVLKITGEQFIAPVKGSKSIHWALLLHPQELGQSSKTHEFDESLLLDWDIFGQLGPLLRTMRLANPTTPMFQMDYRNYLEGFKACVETADLGGLQAHPYSLRHGGASHDTLVGARSLDQVKARGRWRAEASVRRYEKHARILREAERMGPRARDFGNAVEAKLAEVILGQAMVHPSRQARVLPRMPRSQRKKM
jgi:hypothetical protein